MRLLGKYEVLETVEGGGLRTFKARQVSSGRTVLCHDLSSGPNVMQLVRLVVRHLRGAPTRDRSLILDMIEEDGSVYLITEPLPGSGSLSDWLEGVTQGPDASTAPDLDARVHISPDISKPSSQPLPVSQSGSGQEKSVPSEPGDFTRMFQPSDAAKPAEPVQVQPQKTSTSAEGATGIFGAPELDKVAPQPTVKPSRPLTDAGESTKLPEGERDRGPRSRTPTEAGEFTQLFRAPGQTADSTPAAIPSIMAEKPEPTGEQGEFTQVFESYKVSGPLPSSLRQPPAIPGGSEPGEFTKIFQASDMSSGRAGGAPALPVAIQPTEQEGEFTRIFGAGSSKSPPAEPAFRPTSAGPAASMGASAEQPPSAGRPLEPARQPFPPAPTAPNPVKLEGAASVPSPKQPGAPPLPAIPKVSVATPGIPRLSPRLAASVPPPARVPQQKLEPPKPPAPSVVVLPAPRPSAPPAGSPEKTSDERTSYLPLILILAGLALAAVALVLFFR